MTPKTTLYLAITVNGMIAKQNGHVDHVSKQSFAGYRRMIKRAGNVVVGRRTYEDMLEGGDLKGLHVEACVVSRKRFTAKEPFHAVTSPHRALAWLAKQGQTNVLVTGGAHIAASFMKAGLVDELYVDVEPTALGSGVNLFEGKDFEVKLKLLGTKKLSRDEVQLRYKVVK
ncbi:MAG TPA: dihydrofolate reductase family protein [Patescibacteria group bacterium]|jgi:dihydrofolate reductase